MKTQRFCLLAVCLIVLPSVFAGSAQFFGTVTSGGQPIADGTLIEIVGNSGSLAFTIVQSGQYGYNPLLEVQETGGDLVGAEEGESLTFKIGGETVGTAVFTAGQRIETNLVVSGGGGVTIQQIEQENKPSNIQSVPIASSGQKPQPKPLSMPQIKPASKPKKDSNMIYYIAGIGLLVVVILLSVLFVKSSKKHKEILDAITYLRDGMQKGFMLNQLEQGLISNGWPKEVVETAGKEVFKQMTTKPNAQNPALMPIGGQMPGQMQGMPGQGMPGQGMR